MIAALVPAGLIAATAVPGAAAAAVPGCGTPAALTVNGAGNQLDTYSVSGTLLSTATTVDVLGDIAYGADGTLYGAPLYGTPRIEELDPATGAASDVVAISGPVPGGPNGLSSLPSGLLLAGIQGSSVLYEIDPVTGASTTYERALPAGYTSAGDFFVLGDGDLLAVAANVSSSDDFLVRLLPDGTSTVIGSVPVSYGAAFSGGTVYLAGADGTLRRVETLPTSPSTDPLGTTDVVTAGFSMYGAASTQDAAACPTPTLAVGAPEASVGTSVAVTIGGFPPDTDVSVTITDQSGSPVGSVTLHTDADGSIGGSLPIAANAVAGDAAVTAATVDGITAVSQVHLVAAPGVPSITSPGEGTVTNDPRPVVAGQGSPGDAVTVQDDEGRTVCTSTVAPDGRWSCEPDGALPDGDNTLRAIASNALGATASSAPVALRVDTAPPAAPSVTTTALPSATGPLSGTAEAGSTVMVTAADGSELCRVAADDTGTWTCSTTDPLPEGPNSIAVAATDDAGNVSPSVVAEVVSPDRTAPAVPSITGPSNGSQVNDRSPTVTGTAEPGSSITVTLAGAGVVCIAKADSRGEWTCTLSALEDGRYTIEATASDGAGNESEPARTTFVLDTVAPARPIITSPSLLPSGAGPISGTGEPGSTTTVSGDDGSHCTATVRGDGRWECSLRPALESGSAGLTAWSVDAAGNRSPLTVFRVRVASTAVGGVLPAAPMTDASTLRELAFTGVPGARLAGLLLLASACIGTGALLVLRRSRKDPEARTEGEVGR
ncbi:Ig-like domain-containing protein [Curtobacterium sp. UNCCL20]|uniref:Ig-like domain-containing protein n=1 Tax=Curtobacterium sp. UNCCL20 TaxID=1502773 RepID=UPI0011146029|nr:Ig-like domain-containing protein [Curtobacterium sp. UNCCL20]